MFHNGRARHKSLDQNFNGRQRQIRSCLRPFLRLLIYLEFYCHRLSAFPILSPPMLSPFIDFIDFIDLNLGKSLFVARSTYRALYVSLYKLISCFFQRTNPSQFISSNGSASLAA